MWYVVCGALTNAVNTSVFMCMIYKQTPKVVHTKPHSRPSELLVVTQLGQLVLFNVSKTLVICWKATVLRITTLQTIICAKLENIYAPQHVCSDNKPKALFWFVVSCSICVSGRQKITSRLCSVDFFCHSFSFTAVKLQTDLKPL